MGVIDLFGSAKNLLRSINTELNILLRSHLIGAHPVPSSWPISFYDEAQLLLGFSSSLQYKVIDIQRHISDR